MEIIKDCQNHKVCEFNPSTGLLISTYKKQTTSVYLCIGQSYFIARDGTETRITRYTENSFRVTSTTVPT